MRILLTSLFLGILMLQNAAYGIRFKRDDNFAANYTIADIPQSFDARKKWPMCHTISRIRNQGKCASCWAVAAASVMSDRHCILAHRNFVIISAADLVNCCEECAINGDGCQGGQVSDAFKYWLKKGVVTETCKRYYGKKETCSQTCDTKAFKYKPDRNFGGRVYDLTQNMTQIQLDIMVNGPVAAGVMVAHDFFEYNSGVYQHKNDSPVVGAHSLRLIGWGSENGVDYWLAANSFGTDWGDSGYIKILRGANHMEIETYVSAGVPKICEFKECDTPDDDPAAKKIGNGTGTMMSTELMP